jgi:hypothetical protein
MEEDAAADRHAVGLEDVAALVEIDDVAPQQSPHIFVHHHAGVVEPRLRGEQHAQPLGLFHVAVLVTRGRLEPQRQHPVAVTRLRVGLPHRVRQEPLGGRSVAGRHLDEGALAERVVVEAHE